MSSKPKSPDRDTIGLSDFDTQTLGRDLKEPGRAVYQSLVQPGMDMGDISLCEEAGRLRDRLDKLQRLISGDEETWAKLTGGQTGEITVRIDDPVKEARQMTTVYRQLVGDIKRRWPEEYAGNNYDGLEDLGAGPQRMANPHG